jgi:hypothetical protein
MARRIGTYERRASPLYAELGPRPAAVQAYVASDLGLSGDAVWTRADAMLEEYRAWRVAHLEAWLAGKRAPEPPYADVLDTFARLAG